LASSQHHEIFPNMPKIQKVLVTNVLIAMWQARKWHSVLLHSRYRVHSHKIVKNSTLLEKFYFFSCQDKEIISRTRLQRHARVTFWAFLCWALLKNFEAFHCLILFLIYLVNIK
jgi:hypothetical protein